MPSVTSQAVHSLQHGHAPHRRAGTPQAKEPETPFAQLLDQLGPPAPGSDDPAHDNESATASRSMVPGDRAKAGAQAGNKAAGAQSDAEHPDTPQSDAGEAKSSDDTTAAAAAGAADQAVAGATEGDLQADETEGKTDVESDVDTDDGGKDASPSAAAATVPNDTASDNTVQPRGLDIAAAVATVVPPVGPQNRSAPTLPETASEVAVLATGKIAARDPGEPGGRNLAPDPDGEARRPSEAIDGPPASSPLTRNEASAGGPTADTKNPVEAEQTQAEQKQGPGAVADDEGAEPEADGDIAAPAAATPEGKLEEAHASGEQAAAKLERRPHVAPTSPPGDTALAAADPSVTGSPSGAGNTPAGDAIGPAPVPSSDRGANAAAQTVAPPANTPAAALPIVGLAVEIAARAQAGSHRFEIRLDPPELGRVEVRLDMDKNGHVNSRLIIDRPDTLDLLRRDAGDLQRALQQAGLTTTDDGLQFSLRDQSFAGLGNGNGDHANLARLIVSDSEINPAETVAAGYGRMLASGGGIDIRV